MAKAPAPAAKPATPAQQALSATETLRLRAARPEIPDYSRSPDVLHLTLRVAPLPGRAGGRYEPRTRTLTMAEALLAEDPRAIAAGLAHELTHASDFDLIAVGPLPRDCAELEVRAF